MRNRILWGIALLSLLAGCGDDKPAKPKPIASGGPVAPELTWAQGPEHAERVPISLTASDGSGIALLSVEARAVIEDPLAFTELHLRFYNPEPRRREGRFEITLPPAAAISRFAMRVGDEFQEGEVVERRRAQQVYEDFLHYRRDPALLEKDAGNQFAARVFPIEPNAEKEIIVAYSEELPRHDAPYTLLLAGLPQLNQLKVHVQVGSNSADGKQSSERARGAGSKLDLLKQDYAPENNLEVRLPWQKALALRSGDYVVARVAPELKLSPEPLDGLTVLFDTSASRALGFSAQIERLGKLISQLVDKAGDFELRVVAFDQDAQEIYRGKARGFGLREQTALLQREALGATDLAQALAFAAKGGTASARVLLVGDGVITAGAEDTTSLREAVAKLAAHGVRRFDALSEGGIVDRESLAALTGAGLPSAGVVLDASAPIATLVEKLLLGARDRIDVHIAGATFVQPSVLQNMQPGDERLIFAELPAGTPLQIELSGAGAQALPSMEAPKPLVERAYARARIEALSAALRALPEGAVDERARREHEIVGLSVSQRVVSDYTALLVLEGPIEYQRYGIAQNALTNILTVGDDGIELLDRTAPPPSHDDRPLQIAKDKDEEDAPPNRMRIAAEPEPTQEQAQLEAPSAAPAPAAEAAAAPAAAQPAESAREDRGARGSAKLDEAIGASTKGLGSLGTGAGGGALGRAAPASPPPPNKAARMADPADSESDRMLEKKGSVANADGVASAERKAPSGPRSTVVADVAEFEGEMGTGSTASPAKPATAQGRASTPMAIAASGVLEARADVRLHSASGLPSDATAQVLRSGLKARARACYERAGERRALERLFLEFAISDKGTVLNAYVSSGSLLDARAQACVVAAARTLRFPKPEGPAASVQAGIEFSMQPAAQPIANEGLLPRPRPRPRGPAKVPSPALDQAYDGTLLAVLEAIKREDFASALVLGNSAHAADPGDVIGLLALGEALEAQNQTARAARAYGSIIDLFPSRADLRRMAGERLERLPDEAGLPLAVDSYRHAVQQRPDHPSGHRALAYALWQQGEHRAAFEAIEAALGRTYAADRFDGVDRILREDLGLLGAAWVRAEPGVAADVNSVLAANGASLERTPSLRFVLSWETDANDVDFHIYDGRGGHAYYMHPKLPSGGELYADITTGYGPECFAIPGHTRNYPYVLQANYYARGPMGYGMGAVQVIEHDGQGGLLIAMHPFAIMKDKAFVELARMTAPLGGEQPAPTAAPIHMR